MFHIFFSLFLYIFYRCLGNVNPCPVSSPLFPPRSPLPRHTFQFNLTLYNQVVRDSASLFPASTCRCFSVINFMLHSASSPSGVTSCCGSCVVFSSLPYCYVFFCRALFFIVVMCRFFVASFSSRNVLSSSYHAVCHSFFFFSPFSSRNVFFFLIMLFVSFLFYFLYFRCFLSPHFLLICLASLCYFRLIGLIFSLFF